MIQVHRSSNAANIESNRRSVLYEQFSQRKVTANNPSLNGLQVNKEIMVNFFMDHQKLMNTDSDQGMTENTTKKDESVFTSESEANVEEEEGQITSFTIPSQP